MTAASDAYAMALEPKGLDALESFVHGLDHPEGIAIASGGTIYVGGEAAQIYAIEADGVARQIASTGGFVLGLALDGEGRLYACDQGSSASSASILRAGGWRWSALIQS